MGAYLSRYLVRQESNNKNHGEDRNCMLVTKDDHLVLSDRIELDSFALLNQFLTSHPCVSDTFTVPTFMKYRILEDFILFLHQRQIKLYTNYTNKSVISP